MVRNITQKHMLESTASCWCLSNAAYSKTFSDLTKTKPKNLLVYFWGSQLPPETFRKCPYSLPGGIHVLEWRTSLDFVASPRVTSGLQHQTGFRLTYSTHLLSVLEGPATLTSYDNSVLQTTVRFGSHCISETRSYGKFWIAECGSKTVRVVHSIMTVPDLVSCFRIL